MGGCGERCSLGKNWQEETPGSGTEGSGGSVAATRPDHHVLVLLEDDVGVVVEVEHGDGVELGRSAARLGNVLRVHQVNLEGNEGGTRNR